MKIKNIIILVAAFLISVFFNLTNLKSFESWGQVNQLWNSHVSPVEILFHPHMPRYLIVYPGFILENNFPNIGFSFYISLFFALNISIFRKISLLSLKKPPNTLSYLSFSILHIFMNGRGVIIWTAWLICILVCSRVSLRNMRISSQAVLILVSCFFASASTGVFVVIFITYLILIFRATNFHIKTNRIKNLSIIIIISPVSYLILDYFFVSIEKNIDFYGGGFSGAVNMLEHGLGAYLTNISVAGVLATYVLASFLFIFLYHSIINKRKIMLLDYLILISIAGGMFGFTVLTLVIPPLILRVQKILTSQCIKLANSGSGVIT